MIENAAPDWAAVLARVEGLVERVERLLPRAPEVVDWGGGVAFRWRRGPGGRGHLEAVRGPHAIRLDDLRGIDAQKAELSRNTRQFLRGLPANNALLWGARGTGKSSLVKALLNAHGRDGLRAIEVDPHELVDLPDIVEALAGRPERFVLFADDLSFEAGDPSYKALKAMLDGSLAALPDNVLVYATSNRRHLMPEFLRENLEARALDGEIHPGEAVEEKVSLSERFGLWLSFYPFDQERYLEVVRGWVERLGGVAGDPEVLRREALRWALARGSRSGRSASQFARDWVGRAGMPPAL
jgi:hypothetical protein